MLKSVALTTLLLSASAPNCRPISWLVTLAPVRFTPPDVARKPATVFVPGTPCGPFTRQLYAPEGRLPTGTVKKPLASVVRPVYSLSGPPLSKRSVSVSGRACRALGCGGRPCHVTWPTRAGVGVLVGVNVIVGVAVEV